MGMNQSGVYEARYVLRVNIETLEAHGRQLGGSKQANYLDFDSIICVEQLGFRNTFHGLRSRNSLKRKMLVNGKGASGWIDPRSTIYTSILNLKYFPDMKVMAIFIEMVIDVALETIISGSDQVKINIAPIRSEILGSQAD